MPKYRLLRLIIGIAFPVAIIFILFWGLCVKIPIPCVFNHITGLYCPTCGATRAVIYFMHGNITDSLKSNALITLSAIPLLFIFTVMWLGVIFNRKEWYVPNTAVIKFFCVFVVIYIIFGIVRNIPTIPFIWLNPI